MARVYFFSSLFTVFQFTTTTSTKGCARTPPFLVRLLSVISEALRCSRSLFCIWYGVFPVLCSSGQDLGIKVHTHTRNLPMAVVDKDEDYANICGICFTDVDPVENPRGRLNSCNHLFCSYCIKEWAKATNVCPSCKALFTRIYTQRADAAEEEETKVRRRNYRAWEEDADLDGSLSEDSAEYSGPQVLCDVCREGHGAVRMIMCDRRQCTYTAHLECIGLQNRPLTFLCSACSVSTPTASAGAPTVVPPSASSPVTADAISDCASTPVAPPPPPARPARAAAKAPVRTPISGQAGARAAGRTAQPSASQQAPRATEALPPPLPEGPVDFSKFHLTTPPMPPGTRSRPPADSNGADAEDGDLYFLKPTAHSAKAQKHFHQQTQAQLHVSQQRQQLREANVRRMYENRDYSAILEQHKSGPHRSLPHAATKRGRRGDVQQENVTEIAHIDGLLGDERDRQRMEEKMTHEWAAAMLPVLRRKHDLEGSRLRLNASGDVDRAAPLSAMQVEARESALWQKALEQARPMAQQKIKEQLYGLRKRKQELLNAQAQREAAALAKLARVIALHRERTAPR
ncbi:hypothetical protein STCU_06567 [Strigomonas culicis]|uniref:RING-type domain-containing protein n=1 Tax=Strigomonas culicis TaxID=28005 RepID=S9VF68_9TRYP|nr:hypothetical protein STCU_06567 [Strigomonas culicis]|eukprot:EPY25676.1 hypothetical protein STCU_06567 [Strigomonas culicis]